MELRGRELFMEMQPPSGDDVRLLQGQLRQLGASIADAEGVFGEATLRAVSEFQRRHGLPASGVVDERTAALISAEVAKLQPADRPQMFVVRGQARQADGRQLVGAVVRAFDKDLRSEEILGETRTDEAGRYEITYTAEQFRRAEKGSADLVVRVLSEQGLPLADSGLLFNAPPVAMVDLMIGSGVFRGLSEYEQLVDDLTPVLQGLPPADLVEDGLHQDITFLTGETGEDRRHVELLVAAHQLARLTDLPPEVFYGFARENLPTDLPALLAQGKDEQRRALEAALRKNIIPARLRDGIEGILERLLQLTVQQATEKAAEPGRYSLGELLSTAIADTAKRDRFVDVYIRREGTLEELWKALRENPEFQHDVDRLQFTLQLGALTQNHVPLVQELQRNQTLRSIRDLARLNPTAWTALINKQLGNRVIGVPPDIAGKDASEQAANYVHGIVTALQTAFPTDFVAQIVAEAPEIDLSVVRRVLAQNPQMTNLGQALPDNLNLAGLSEAEQQLARASLEALRQEINTFPDYGQQLVDSQVLTSGNVTTYPNTVREQVSRFFQNAPTFDFRFTPVNTYLAEHDATAFDGIEDRAVVTNQLKRLQRAFQVSVRPESTRVLLAEGMDSAQRIASIPRETFVREFKEKLGGEEQAVIVHTRSDHVNSSVMNLYVQLWQARNDVTPFVMSGSGLDTPMSGAEPFGPSGSAGPDGPLDDAGGGGPASPPDVVKHPLSYPDLFGPLELCACEHCRSVYSPAAYFVDLLQFLNPTLPPKVGRVPREALFARRPDLQYIKLTCENTNTPIPYVDLVNEILETYVALDKLDGTARDTGDATADELSANPQFINEDAYEKLAGVLYPLTLPFNQPLEVARTYLEHLGSSRHELMQLLRKSGKTGNLDIASEYLKISPQERAILLEDSPKVLSAYYYARSTAPAEADLVASLRKVPEFLKQTGVSYLDLIELVQTRFLNPEQAIALKDPSVVDSCDLKNTIIDGLGFEALRKAHRFLRLWRKLGWSIRDLDRSVTALGAGEIHPSFLQKLAQVVRLQTELNVPLAPLLSLWSDIDTQREDSLYKKVFLSKAAQKLDDVFEPRADGSVLTASGLKISEHIHALLAALRVSATDLALIRADAALDSDDARLNLRNLSALYRYSVLAKALKISVKDLISLKTLTGTHPFSAPDQTSLFLEVVRKVRQTHFSIAQLDYLYRHLSEPAAGLAPQPENLILLAKTLRDGLNKITQDNRLVPDPTGDVTRSKLGAIFDSAIVDQAIAMINGSAVYTTPLAILPEKPKDFAFPASLMGKISYDAKTKLLQSRGALTQKESDDLQALSKDPAYLIAIKMLFQQPRDLVANIGFGSIGSLDALDKAVATLLYAAPSPASGKSLDTEDRFGYVLQQLLPYWCDRLGRMLVKQTLSDALKLDSEMAELLLESTSVLTSRAAAKQPAIDDFLALRDGGLAAAYFEGVAPKPTGKPALLRSDPIVDFNWGAHSPIRLTDPPEKFKPFSARWTGRLLAAQSDTYTFYARADAGVRLWIDDKLLIDNWKDLAKDEPAAEHSRTLELTADRVYGIRMEYYNKDGRAVAQLRWSSPSTPKAVVPQNILFTTGIYDTFVRAFTQIDKVASLINNFKLTPKELTYLSLHGADFAGLDLKALPLDRSNPSTIDSNAAALVRQWERLFDLTAFRDGLPLSNVGLTDVFGASSVADAKQKLILATGWDDKTLDALAGASALNLGADDFKNESWLIRLQACVRLGRRLGVSVATLFGWARFDWTTESHVKWQRAIHLAQAIKDAAKAKYDASEWLRVAKALNDAMRETQKAALIAYLLADPVIITNNIVDSNGLFQYFLIDVDMSACMATSRIKQAIASVQLFVQRCLMNLEWEWAQVSPTAIDADQWTWMKHYRVWEANRKILLYPENWIEEELRDNKSPFFEDLESELLQNDVTTDTAETAFLNYLEKLDEVARLEICGMYVQENDPDTGEKINITHVFGRTFNTPHIYYYRQLVKGVTWTPWEKVQVDIASVEGTEHTGDHSGVHLMPVVWNRRLYLFWPIFTQKAEKPTDEEKKEGADPRKYWEIKIAWSEYKQGKWSPKQVSASVIRSLMHKLSASETRTFRYGLETWTITDTTVEDNLPDEKDHFFRIDESLGILHIHVYRRNTYPAVIVHHTVITGGSPLPRIENRIDNERRFVYDDLGDFIVADKNGKSISELKNTPLPFGSLHMPQYTENDFMFFTAYSDAAAGDPSPGSAPATDLWLPQDWTPPIRVLKVKPSTFSLLSSPKPPNFAFKAPLFFQDADRTYFVTQWFEILSLGWAGLPVAKGWKFHTHFHPYVGDFVKALNRKGVPGLLTIGAQRASDLGTDAVTVIGDNATQFYQKYKPTEVVGSPYPVENVDFGPGGAYSLYNWEVFFHAPLLLAERLSNNQRFEEAQRWFHYIYNPTSISSEPRPQRYWNILPFKTVVPERIEDLMVALSYTGNGTDDTDEEKALKLAHRAELEAHVELWRSNPFNPHLIARLRSGAYQKNVVMKYIENLIAWGDQLFHGDTVESINEATQLYVLAAEMLGQRPQLIPLRGKVQQKTYDDLKPGLDKFSNALVDLETAFPFSGISPSPDGTSKSPSGGPGVARTLYFCIPQNDKLLGYWDTVADRLFKIRHCMDIEGVVRELPLFEPPIDPALLVQAVARGVDLSSALNDLNASLAYYRFTYLVQKALELCGDVRSLGAALLSALEKKDAEALAAMRAGQETVILNLMREVKNSQLSETQAVRDGLDKTWEMTEHRRGFYADQLAEDGGLSGYEHEQQHQLSEAQGWSAAAQVVEAFASSAFGVPEVDVGTSGTTGSPVLKVRFGGSNIGHALHASSTTLNYIAAVHTYWANQAGTQGAWERRSQEWKLQEETAAKELQQIEKQKLAADIRIAIATREIATHDQQIENAQQVEVYWRSKYTNQALYDWMVSETSALYFQCYQLAYDLAKRAERAYRFERGLTTSNFIQFGYWDSLKKGLLSGERLHLALRQMERAYLEQNKREYELSRNISLVLHDPMALISLKETGSCEVELPEALFDMDYPGHYMRRIKIVSLTIPCVVGPYASVNCTLTLLRHKTRIASNPQEPYLEQDEDKRFITNFGAVQSIATSHAQNDSGLFELNFRDERYLPFEGAGLVSRWRIEMPQDCNAFDFETIADVILHFKYTAREGGQILRNAARSAAGLPEATGGSNAELAPPFPQEENLQRLFSAKHEFPTEWHSFLHPRDTMSPSRTMQIGLTRERFPWQLRGRAITIKQISLFLKIKDVDGHPATVSPVRIRLTAPADPPPTPPLPVPDPKTDLWLTSDAKVLGGIPHVDIVGPGDPPSLGGSGVWLLTLAKTDVDGLADKIDDLIIVCQYSSA